MQSQIEARALNGFEMRTTFSQIGDEKIIGSSVWQDAEGRPDERHHVLTIRDGKITDMQVCGSRRQAKRFAKRTGRVTFTTAGEGRSSS